MVHLAFDSSENFNGKATCQNDSPIVSKQPTIKIEFEYACFDCLHQNWRAFNTRSRHLLKFPSRGLQLNEMNIYNSVIAYTERIEWV